MGDADCYAAPDGFQCAARPTGGIHVLQAELSQELSQERSLSPELSEEPSLAELSQLAQAQESELSRADWAAPFALAQDALRTERVSCSPQPMQVLAQRPAWSVGDDLQWRFPQAVQSARSAPVRRAQYCCEGSGCQLRSAPEGTPECWPVLGAATLGAAKAKCELACSGEKLQALQPGAQCYEEGDCRATQRGSSTCYASRDVCLAASAQRASLQSVGSL